MLLNDHDNDPDHDPNDGDGGDFDDGGDNNSQGSGKRSRTRRPHLQGRFSGRLTTKEDERRLAEECKLLGPLLGGVGKRGDKSRLTLAKIVRGIATGDVRRFCEERERAIQLLKQKLAAIDPEAAASVPVHPIPISCVSLGGPGGSMSMGNSLGSMGVAAGVVEALQRENAELQHEAISLRTELQARERLLLELQDTGIISGFHPTSIPLKEEPRLLPMGPPGAARGLEAAQYGLPPRQQSYGMQHVGSYGGPSQMSMQQPQGSAHFSGGSMEAPAAGPMAAMAPGPAMPAMGLGAAGLGSDSVSLPAMSEHSRAGRPAKRPAPSELAPHGHMQQHDVPRSLSHPSLGRGGGGGGGGYGSIDLQSQLNSLQAQVEHLQHLSQGAGRRPPAAAPRLGGVHGGGMAGGGGGVAASPFHSSLGGNQQAGLLMLQGQAEGGGGGLPFHPAMGAPLHLQPIKNQAALYDDLVGSAAGRDTRGQPGPAARHAAALAAAAAAAGHAAGDDPYGGGPIVDQASLEHMFNSRTMRGEYDLPMDMHGHGHGPGQH